MNKYKIIFLLFSLPILILLNHLLSTDGFDYEYVIVIWLLEGLAFFIPNFGWNFGFFSCKDEENKIDDSFDAVLKESKKQHNTYNKNNNRQSK